METFVSYVALLCFVLCRLFRELAHDGSPLLTASQLAPLPTSQGVCDIESQAHKSLPVTYDSDDEKDYLPGH